MVRGVISRKASLAALILVGVVATGCGGSSEADSTLAAEPLSKATSTGALTVAVTDPEGRSLAGAWVTVFNDRQTKVVGSARTNSGGLATVGSVPSLVIVSVFHEFGYVRVRNIGVAQSGGTNTAVIVPPVRPRPSVALLPVEVPPASVSTDRSELTLQVSLVASSLEPFVPAGYGDYSAAATPSLGLELGDDADDSERQCYLWLDQRNVVPSCGAPWDPSPYTVSVEHFSYSAVGTATPRTSQPPSRHTMLVLDQSRRVAALDPGAFRSFAARRFIEYLLSAAVPGDLAIAGFAGDAGDAAAPALLPDRPLSAPLGTSAPFSNNEGLLKSGVGVLEPLVGGSAAVFDGLAAAVSLTATTSAPGNRTVVVMLGGGDDSEMSSTERALALASLRRQRDDTAVRSILIDGSAQGSRLDHRDVADLAAALRAPTVSLGVTTNERDFYLQSWASGANSALELAADLVEGKPLPTLSATFRVKSGTGAFPSGATLRGVLYVESDICPMGCWEIPVAFSVIIP
jgi:hypothetical protein